MPGKEDLLDPQGRKMSTMDFGAFQFGEKETPRQGGEEKVWAGAVLATLGDGPQYEGVWY